MNDPLVITGSGAVCASGRSPNEIWNALTGGETCCSPIRRWSLPEGEVRFAGEIRGMKPRDLVPDRKVHKLLRRTDLLGLYAASQAIGETGWDAQRENLDDGAASTFSDRSAVYVGSGGNSFENLYEFLPLIGEAAGDMPTFARELSSTVHPMWLLRTLPNNVLCHTGINHMLKGPNGCVTSHCISGVLAISQAVEALLEDKADRALVVAHDTPVEPEMVLYYDRIGLMDVEAMRPFDAEREGCLLGEGAAAVAIERESVALAHGAPIRARLLGQGFAGEAGGIFAVRDDGDGLARAITAALDDAEIAPADVGLIVAHGSGTRNSDASEVAAIRRIFGETVPPVTAFKWCFGHTLAASSMLDAVLAVELLEASELPGIGTLRDVDPVFDGFPVSPERQAPRGDVALVLSRAFGGMNGALVLQRVAAAKS